MVSIESKTTEVKKPLTKNQIVANIVETTGLAKKEVNSFLDALTDEIKKSLDKKGAGAFVLPGLFKIDKKQVKAQPAKTNVPNPFRPGELINKPAKPAHHKVRVRPLKILKEMVGNS
ncbi:MAG: HU family DNA-binding protein [Planctomycetaceae bacterium]|jgi:nucleoid DNA-binding protein|nr:HU family DNA-binding protein [Planctomycetaceae bacterium]